MNSKRIMIIPDTQIKPGVDTKHIDWAAQYIVDMKPDNLVVIGDWWDMPSCSSHDKPGSVETEGRRIRDDIDCGNEAMERLVAPAEREQARLKRNKEKQWVLDKDFLFGNHEKRLERVVSTDAKWDGILSLDAMKTPGFTRHEFLKIVNIQGIKFCHYFSNPLSGRPIGGSIQNRLGHIGSSFVQGHQQGMQYSMKTYPDHIKHGLVCGRFYSHHETYRPEDVQKVEWNGVIVLNEAYPDGSFDMMPVSYKYLEKTYG